MLDDNCALPRKQDLRDCAYAGYYKYRSAPWQVFLPRPAHFHTFVTELYGDRPSRVNSVVVFVADLVNAYRQAFLILQLPVLLHLAKYISEPLKELIL